MVQEKISSHLSQAQKNKCTWALTQGTPSSMASAAKSLSHACGKLNFDSTHSHESTAHISISLHIPSITPSDRPLSVPVST